MAKQNNFVGFLIFAAGLLLVFTLGGFLLMLAVGILFHSKVIPSTLSFEDSLLVYWLLYLAFFAALQVRSS